MEVVVPMAPTSTSPEFHFSLNPSPYASAPSSPKAFGNPNDYFYRYTSAPNSPGRAAAAVYSYIATADSDELGNGFDFGSSHLSELNAADELFEKGRIRPSKPSSPRPEALGTSPRESRGHWPPRGGSKPSFSSLSTICSATIRGDRCLSEETTPVSSQLIKRNGSKKWRLKDLLLFRSASEGRATGRESKDPLRKYTVLSPSSSSSLSMTKRQGDHHQRTIERSSRRGSAVSTHELHYTANRAAAEEAKKKTPLAYNRNSFFGCLHFNPAVKSITGGGRGFNSSGSFSRRQS